MQFSTLLGQKDLKIHLQNAIRNDTVSHAYLFTGEAGMGKRTVARLFAQTLQCSDRREVNGMIEPCGKCTACIQAVNGTHPDIRILTPAKASSIGVDDIRSQIVEDSFLMPFAAAKKIYLVPEAEKMTVEAQNALLKTLEEPPAYVTILLLSANENAFLPTILSRVVMLPLKPVADEAIRDYLMREMKVTDYSAHMAVQFALGNVGRARMLAGSDSFTGRLKRTVGLLGDLRRMQIVRMNAVVQEILAIREETEEDEDAADTRARARQAVNDFLQILTALCRDMLVYKASGREDLLIFAGEMSYISKACEQLSYADIARTLDDILHAEGQLRANGNADLILQILLMNLKERIQTA